MRGVVTLLLVFGSVAFIFILHWIRRASSAADDASRIFKETGSIRETARTLYREQSEPDLTRLSRRQIEYVNAHKEEFLDLYGRVIFAQTEEGLERWRMAQSIEPSESQIKAVTDHLIAQSSMRFAKIYCSDKGIY